MGLESLRGKRAFITGGSSGIGFATAALLVKSGAHVCIAARRQEQLDGARAALAKLSSSPEQRIGALRLDVSDGAAVRAVVPQVIELLGGIDLVINNAGVATPGYVQVLDDETFRTTMEINYFGSVYVTRAFLPQLLAQGSGHVSFVSSLAGLIGVFGYTAYTPTKFAITGFAECLRQEMLPHGIAVSVLFPADADTPMLHAENLVKPAETKAISGNVKVMSADDVAAVYVEGIAAGAYAIVPGIESKFSVFMQRHFPGIVAWVMDGAVKKARKQLPR